jgi:spore maturation protein CgeB
VRVAILGLSITSSWGNGHATNYRGLVRALADRGDEVTFLERDRSWYAAHRDLPQPPGCTTVIYDSVEQLRGRFARAVREADLVIVGSFVPEGVDVAAWVLAEAGGAVAFYDIDTPVTLEKLRHRDTEYLAEELVPRFDLYLSFTAGPALTALAEEFGAGRPVAFYCFVDPDLYQPAPAPRRWTLNYLGTYAPGRQPALDDLLLEPARQHPCERYCVAGPMYPTDIHWPANVERIEHIPPAEHPAFYCAAAFTLNLTRPEMRATGYSPSVRLFEAAACGVPIISDTWPGIETVFVPGEEIFLADGAGDVLRIVRENGPVRRQRVAGAARRRVLAEHTATRRAEQLHELIAQPVGTAAA